MSRILKFTTFPTIKQYLAMKDWVFEPLIEEGVRRDYYWVRFPSLGSYFPMERVEPPLTPFCVVLKPDKYDRQNFESILRKRGWKRHGNIAISNWGERTNVRFKGRGAKFIIDTLISDSKIIEAVADWDDYLYVAPTQIERFLDIVDQLQPHCCSASNVFVARGKEAYQQFFNEEFLAEYKHDQWKWTKASRAKLWKMLGPECGPEICVEPDCDRLRIQLSIRCFVHHAMGKWMP